MQTPCLSPRSPAPGFATAARAAARAWTLVILSLPAVAGAAPPVPRQAASAAADAAVLPWPEGANPEQALARVVTGWVAAQTGSPASSLQLAPLDPRLQIRSCPAGIRLDNPFASRETVRVRCAEPNWQLHVRVLGIKPVVAEEPATAASEPAPPRTRKVLVANALLQRGTRLTAEQLSVTELPATGLPPNVLENANDVVNAEVVRDILAGTPLRSQDIRPALMVKKGQLVLLSAGLVQGFRVQARVEALQDGRLGEQIRLKSRESGRELSGLVTGFSTAQAL